MPEFVFAETPVQRAFIGAALSGLYRFLLFGGGIRSGKTYGVLALLLLLCRIYPGSRWAVVRKDLPTLKRNVFPTFSKIRPPRFCGEIQQYTRGDTDWMATCANGSKIIFFPESISEDPDLSRWKGLEVNGFAPDEVDELHEKSWHKMVERAGSWIIPNGGRQPLPLILATCNPSPGFVKELFYDPFVAGTLKAPYFFQPATIADNTYADAEHRASLEYLPEAEYRRFVKGEWEGLDGTRLFRELREEWHLVGPLPPHPAYAKVVVADWGWTNPAPAIWFETDTGLDQRAALSRAYREWWPVETVPATWAEEVVARSALRDPGGQVVGYETTVIILDSAVWARGQDGSPSVAEQMLPTLRKAGWTLQPAQKGPSSLRNSTMLLHTYLETGRPVGTYPPALVIDRACPLLWKEITSIKHGDPSLHIAQDQDIEAPHQSNHGTAVLRYWCMSRPRAATPAPAELLARNALYQKLKSSPESWLQAELDRKWPKGRIMPPVRDTPEPKRGRQPWQRKRQ